MNDLSALKFVSYRQLLTDLESWERRLPAVDGVVGVPRSGVLVASYLSLRRNIRLVPLDLLLRDPAGCLEKSPLRASNPAMKEKHFKPLTGRILVVDDCVSQHGMTMQELREKLKETPLQIQYGAVYRAAETTLVDHFFCEIPQPRMFEWNFFRHWNMHFSMWDIDGALCEDWTGVEDNQPESYLQHLASAKPLYIPEQPIHSVVTHRLEKYRALTETWLRQHRVKYTNLIMCAASSPEQRRKKYAPRGAFKAEVYAMYDDAKLFVESSLKEALVVKQQTRKPVLSIETMSLV